MESLQLPPIQETIRELGTAKVFIKQVRTFLDTRGWLREFIPNFAEVAASISDFNKTKVKKKFYWNKSAEQAFQELKRIASQFMSLLRPDNNLQYSLQTDAR